MKILKSIYDAVAARLVQEGLPAAGELHKQLKQQVEEGVAALKKNVATGVSTALHRAVDEGPWTAMCNWGEGLPYKRKQQNTPKN
jgi:hypothetical protein